MSGLHNYFSSQFSAMYLIILKKVAYSSYALNYSLKLFIEPYLCLIGYSVKLPILSNLFRLLNHVDGSQMAIEILLASEQNLGVQFLEDRCYHSVIIAAAIIKIISKIDIKRRTNMR